MDMLRVHLFDGSKFMYHAPHSLEAAGLQILNVQPFTPQNTVFAPFTSRDITDYYHRNETAEFILKQLTVFPYRFTQSLWQCAYRGLLLN